MADRKATEEKYQWRLEDLVASDEAWEKEFKELKANSGVLTKYRGKLTEKREVLACFREDEEFQKKLARLYSYASMRHDEDTRVSKYLAMNDKIDSLYANYAAQCSFLTPELAKLSDETLQGFIADPEMRDYDYLFRMIIKDKPHVLGEGEERILAMASEATGASREIFEMLDNADLNLPSIEVDGQEVALTHGLYSVFLQSPDRDLRKRAFEAYYSAYKKLIHAIASAYHSNVKKDWFYAKARNYSSCMEMALSGNDVDAQVYRNLVEEVDKNLNVLHEYVDYKKQALGVDRFYMYDMYVPIVPGADLKLPYEEAFGLVKKGLACLGEDYQNLLQRAHDERWIDVMENDGKRSGAYSSGVYPMHPYVLLNYQQTTHDVFTIAHELGHAMHSYHSNERQPQAKADYVIFVAEVASTVNEVLLLRYITEETKDAKLRKYLLSYLLETLRTTLFRQTQFAEFEKIAHEMVEGGEPLTFEELNDVYLKLNKKYYGKTVEEDGCISYEWARIPHFYRAFYVYQYATGIISAVSIADKILKEGKPAVERYKQFLSSGGSDSPVELLKIAGVDLLSKEPYEKAMKVFADTLQELENC